MNVGLWRVMLRLPARIGRWRVASVATRAEAIMDGLSDDHRALHRFIVVELPRAGAPLTIDGLAEQRGLPPATVRQLLDDLGARKALIARDDHGAVVWAYPITVSKTPHRLSFKSGERLYAA
ncbi:MAG: hypothetical protein OEU32_04685 [Acidimicrobiia bacterium]|nr:hypothetical protein [Acidimicrobiia bacterium]